MSYGAPTPTAVDAVLASGYTPPSATAVDGVLTRTGPYYGAPLPTAVDAVLQAGYTPPSAIAIDAVLSRVPPSGILASGWDSLGVGDASVTFRNRSVAPAGFDSASLGAPSVGNTRLLAAFGINQFLMGALLVSKQIREVYPTGFDSFGAGTAVINDRVRSVYPQWFTTMFIGAAQAGGSRQIAPSGLLSEVIGAQWARDNRQLAEPSGLAPGSFGDALVALQLREIRASYLPPESSTRIGEASIRNSTRYITPEYIFSQWNNDEYGEPYLANRNRVVDLIINGIKPPFRSVSPFATIFNNARAISPEGFEGVFGSQLIAHGIRNVYPVGFDSFYQIPQFHIVYNRADVAAPTGFNAQEFGTPSLVNTRRYMPPVSITPDDAYGLPFVAPRVRTLAPVIGIQPQLMEGTTIWPGTRPITPATINWPFPGSAFGNLAFSIIERKIRCPTVVVPPAIWGENRIANVRRSVGPYWYSDLFTLFGRAAIFNRNNYFEQIGFTNQAFGPTVQIADRRLRITAPSVGAERFGVHQVRNDIPDPPGVQYAFAGMLGYEIVGTQQFGATTIHANSLYPTWTDLGSFGGARVFGNSLRPLGMPAYFDPVYGGQFGLVSLNGPQGITCNRPMVGEFAKPRVTPHTIYCTTATPAQAVENHPESLPFHPIDALVNAGIGGAAITLKNRLVYPGVFYDLTEFGVPFVSANPTLVNLGGIKSQKFGIPDVSDPSVLRVEGIPDTSRFGASSINIVDALVRYVRPLGMAQLVFGDADPQLKNRAIPVTGQVQSAFGFAFVQRPPPPAEPIGSVMAIWGNNMIAYRIRSAQFEGFDSFVCDYDPDFFERRMRVTKRNYISPAGLSGQTFGHIGIGPRPMHFIAPDGFTHWPIQNTTIAHA